jgi:acyl-CoA thioesterase-2
MDEADTQPSFPDLMDLRAEGDDVLIGSSPDYPWGRVYGGLVVSQGLRAAYATVGSEYRVHSLHAYFLLPGTHEEPIRYEVDRIRDGRSFTTRRVVAHQASGAILNLSASFQVDEDDADVQLAVMPRGLPKPTGQPREEWNAYLENRVNPEPEGSKGHTSSWIRLPDCPSDDPVLQACALAYASDEMPMVAAMFAHPLRPNILGSPSGKMPFMSASLDHAIWFHRPGRADDWMLHDVECQALGSARGLTIARIFGHDGTHVATVSQEVLLRRPRARAAS